MVIEEVSFRREVVTFTAQSRPPEAAPSSKCSDSDTVSLSPQAQQKANAGAKAEGLLAALDADKDGSIGDDEFVDGGTALLRRASHRRRSQDDDSETGVQRGGRHRSHRLEHRLERLRDRPAELRECVVNSGPRLGVVTTRDLDAMAVTDYEARMSRCLRNLYRVHGRQPR